MSNFYVNSEVGQLKKVILNNKLFISGNIVLNQAWVIAVQSPCCRAGNVWHVMTECSRKENLNPEASVISVYED